MGLREEKKARTRERIAEVAIREFLEHGYGAVTMAEVARRAEVSPATLFNYFPSKEAMVFDRAPAIAEQLAAAIRTRRPGTSILRAFRAFVMHVPSMRRPPPPEALAFQRFVEANPPLADYERRTFREYEAVFAAVVQEEAGVGATEAEAVAALAFEAFLRAKRSADPRRTLDRMLAILERGWRG